MKLNEFKRVKQRKYLDAQLEEGVLYISDEMPLTQNKLKVLTI